MVFRDVKVTNCYLSILSVLYKRWKKQKTKTKTKKNVEMSPQYGFSNFQVPKILEKNMQKNLILHFFEMSAFETE